jgi:hypothetical protein
VEQARRNPMKASYLGIIILCVAVALGTVACSGGGVAPNGMNGVQIIAMSNNVTVDSLQFVATDKLGMMGDTAERYSVGVLDKTDRALHMTTTSPDIVDYTVQRYIVDDWLYKIDSDYSTSWIKTQLNDNIWEEQNAVERTMELLDDFLEAKYVGMENISGFNCYKIEIDPNWDAIFSAIHLEEPEGSSTEELIDMFKHIECNVWIAENSYYPMQIFYSMTIDMPFLGEMTMDVTMTFSEFNQPVTITLPAAAQNAEEVSYEDFLASEW